jgi:GT2 family glycosyltransferase
MMQGTAKLTNKYIRLQFMRLVKFCVGLFPEHIKIKLRKQHWLLNLYSKNLQRSGFFYGFPSAAKLQKLYIKNIALQTIKLQSMTAHFNSKNAVNVVVVLSGNKEMDLASMLMLEARKDVNFVYLAGGSVFVSNVQTQISSKALSIKTANISALTNAGASPVLMLRSGDVLHKNAISVFLSHASKYKSIESVLYCDCDYLNAKGERHKAEFYPDWSPDLQLSSAYIKTGLLVSGVNLLDNFTKFITSTQSDGAMSLWLTSLYLADPQHVIVHVPYTLVHQGDYYSLDWYKCLQTLNYGHFLVSRSPEKQVVKIQWNDMVQPLVSLIIPTKNAKSLVKTCIESIVNKTTYANYEILLIDNNSDDPEAIDFFNSLNEQSNIRVLSYPHPFNYSAINNFAVQYARGEVVGLLNNDTEVISPEWLTYMVGHSLRDDVGCVGAKLLYPDDRIQHAGVVMGYGGGAGHAHKYFPRYHPGYLHRLSATNNFSAVTGACLLVKKSDYLAVNGLNENDLTIAFNDIDFCLRVLQLGRRNLYCAEAVLYHHESISRGLDDTHAKRSRFEKELNYLQKNWKVYIDNDPAYNPNLTLRRENFSIKE